MAAMDGGSEDAPDLSPILPDIDETLSHILLQIDVTSKEDIVHQIAESIDAEDIEQNRIRLFGLAVDKFEQTLKDSGMLIGKPNFELKNRRNDVNRARDIFELFLYVSGQTSDFPKDILHNRSTYIDILSKCQERYSKTDPKDRRVCDADCMCKAVLQEVTENYDKCERSLVKLREYVIDVEQAIREQMTEIMKKLGETGINGLKSKDKRTSTIDPNSEKLSTQRQTESEAVENRVVVDRITQPAVQNSYAQVVSPKDGRARFEDGLFTVEEPSLSQLLRDTQQDQGDQRADLNVSAGHSLPSADSSRDIHRSSGQQTNANDTKRGPDISDDDDDLDVIIVSDTNQKGIQTDSYSKSKNRHKKPNTGVKNKDSNAPIKFASTQVVHNDNDGKWELVGKKQKPQIEKQNQLAAAKPKNDARNLTGGKPIKGVDLYVQNIERKQGESLRDVSEIVKNYCRRKDVRVMYARVIQNRYHDDVVGVKISVPINQVDDALGNRIWPDGVTCRRWKNSTSHNNYGNNNDDRRRANDESNRSRERDEINRSREGDDSNRPRERDENNRSRERDESNRSRELENDEWWHKDEGGNYGGRYENSRNDNDNNHRNESDHDKFRDTRYWD